MFCLGGEKKFAGQETRRCFVRVSSSTSAERPGAGLFDLCSVNVDDDINKNELVFNMMRPTANLWARIATQKSLLRGKNVLTLEHVGA